jgi:hypothetical protein
LTVDSTTDRESSTKDFLDGTREFTSQRLETHGTGNFDNILKSNVTRVLDCSRKLVFPAKISHPQATTQLTVLFLLTVTERFLKSLDDQRGSRGDNGNLSLTVLNGQLNSDTKTLPVLGTLGDIFTNLLGRQTKRTDLGSYIINSL